MGTSNNTVLLFAMEGLFSRRVFESLLQQGVEFEGVVLPGRSSITNKVVANNKLNVLNTESIESLAHHHQIPLIYIQGKDIDQYHVLLQKEPADLILVACFPYLLPQTVFRHNRYGAYNIHPSLLPTYKGPMPLFWQFYFGDMTCGISIHEIDASFDTGNIVLQQVVMLEDGSSSVEATSLLANAAVTLVNLLLEQIVTGQLQPIKQDHTQGSYYSWPGLEQFTIPTSWTARRAFNFIHGTRHWNQAYTILIEDNGEKIQTTEAIAFYSEPCSAVKHRHHDSQQLIQFNQGCLLISQ